MTIKIEDAGLAAPAFPMTPRDARLVSDLIVHHTAGPTTQSVEDVDREHRAIGDAMIGYNYVILPAGTIVRGRPVGVVPAASFGRNVESINVCLIGNFHRPDPGYTGSPAPEQIASLKALLEQLHVGYPSVMRTIGHRDVAQLLVDLSRIAPSETGNYATACPGDDLAALIPEMLTELRAQLLRR